MLLKLETAPTVEPVTATEVKLNTRIDGTTEDSLIAYWITSARQQAETYQKSAYITQTWELSFDQFPVGEILLPRSPIQEVLSFKYYDTASTEYDFDLSNFDIDVDNEPGRIIPAYNISYPSVTLRNINGIKIQYDAGYGDAAVNVPSYIKDAIFIYCAYRYENRVAEGEYPKQFYEILRPHRMYL